MRDNPILGDAEIARAESFFAGVFYQRFILGEWVLSEGLVYDFGEDNIVDEILARSKKGEATRKPEPIIPSEISDEKEYVYLSNSPDTCPVCGSSLLNENYCPVCNLKFSFDK